MSCKRLDAVPLLPPRLRSVSRACERSTGTSWPGCHVRCLLSIKFVGEDSSFKSDVLKKNWKYGDKTLTWVRVFHLILFNLLHLKVCVQHFKYSAFFLWSTTTTLWLLLPCMNLFKYSPAVPLPVCIATMSRTFFTQQSRESRRHTSHTHCKPSGRALQLRAV